MGRVNVASGYSLRGVGTLSEDIIKPTLSIGLTDTDKMNDLEAHFDSLRVGAREWRKVTDQKAVIQSALEKISATGRAVRLSQIELYAIYRYVKRQSPKISHINQRAKLGWFKEVMKVDLYSFATIRD